MPAVHRHDLDIVKELRLRRWAREHHVPPAERGAAWHAVVHDEMRRKDDEMLIRSRSRTPANAFVPLAPTAIQWLDRDEKTARPEVSVRPPAARTSLTQQQRADMPHGPMLPHVIQTAQSETRLDFQQIATLGID